jgi:DHA3 family macrolide efflux protein-like MFS transporter
MSRTFALFILTQTLSLIGSRMTGVAVGIRVFERTGDAAPLLIAAFFAELPLMAAGIFAGALADRWEKRSVIVLGDAGQAAGTLLLLFSFMSGAFQLWHLYVVMFLQGVFSATQSPASDAAITALVPAGQRDRANGLREIGFPLAGAVAPALAGFVYAFAGLEAVMGVDLLTFAVAVGVMLHLTIPRAPTTTEGQRAGSSLTGELLGGWAFLTQRRGLLALVLYLAFVFFLINGPLEMAIPYMLTRTGEETVLGLLLGIMSGGALAGGVAIALIGNIEQRVPVMLAGYLLHGCFLIAYGMARHPMWLGISVFLAMFPLPFNGALFSTLVQSRTPPDMQGRIFALTGQIFTLATPLSFLLTAWLVDSVLEPAVNTAPWAPIAPLVGDNAGAGMGLLLASVGTLIVVATAMVWRLPGVRTLETDLPAFG